MYSNIWDASCDACVMAALYQHKLLLIYIKVCNITVRSVIVYAIL